MTQSFEDKMRASAKAFGIELDESKLEQLYTYYEMLVEKNKVMNLTGITEEGEVVTKHFADSLSIAKAVDLDEMRKSISEPKLIDVGTGAGFPGLVLKIVYPWLHVTLFDSLNKRLVFLKEVIDKLSLENVTTVHGRAEDFGHDPEFREQYDIVVSRAVANMSTLLEYCLPFVNTTGIFAAYKSVETDDELKNAEGALNKLGGKITGKVQFTLPETDMVRCIVTVGRNKPTPKKYPRKAGMPSSDPLK